MKPDLIILFFYEDETSSIAQQGRFHAFNALSEQ